MSSNQSQFLRAFSLVVAQQNGTALDLSQLRIKFSVKRSGIMTPNVASIRVYNMDQNSAATIKNEFTQVILQAGYSSNYGVIFNGTIKQVILGRENATDTFMDIFAGDADLAYNYAIVNQTLASGSNQNDHLNVAIGAMNAMGTTTGYQSVLPTVSLPRAKILYGNARDTIQRIAQSTESAWSIQDGKIIFVKLSTYMPAEAVVLTSKTGVIGTPQQTIQGINIKCLLNPKLKIHQRVQIDNKSVAQFQLDFTQPGSPANTPVPLSNDGVYYINIAEHSGDTRAQSWYTDLVCLTVNQATNVLESVGTQ